MFTPNFTHRQSDAEVMQQLRGKNRIMLQYKQQQNHRMQ